MKLNSPLVMVIIIAALCLVIFYFESRGRVSKEDFGVKGGKVLGEPWRFLTFMFTHDGMGHLLMNLTALLLVGSLALGLGFSGLSFAVVFLVVGPLTIIPAILLSSPYTFVGASAGISGLFGAVSVRLKRYGFSAVPFFILFAIALTATPAAEALYSQSAAAATQASMHFLALVLGAGLAVSMYRRPRRW
ncbi:MAG: rhomboid family intramembrane serine protease [Candidatus Bathyarchaeia archaeon]